MFETPYALKAVDVDPPTTVSRNRVSFCEERYSNDCPAATERFVQARNTNKHDSKTDDTVIDDGCKPLSVSFSRNVTIRQTLHHLNYTSHEINECWYKPWEIDEIRAECIRDIERWLNRDVGIEDDKTDCGEPCCLRGLESYEPKTYRRKHRLRQRAAKAVFDIENNGGDSTTIANMYSAL
eukprot:jgi/Psemu1/300049/fgenesh1_kg.5_\